MGQILYIEKDRCSRLNRVFQRIQNFMDPKSVVLTAAIWSPQLVPSLVPGLQ
jgi:hypothetical protein